MNQSRRLRLSKLSLGLVVALAAAPAFAQSTSAGVGGLVTDNGGQPVAGAEVTITHVESGTVSRATTDASGRYTARGLRVGGPYEILITKAGTGTKTEDNVFLQLNQVSTVNAALGADDATTLASVAVVGTRGLEVFTSDNKGVGTSVSGRQLELTPQGSRAVDDVARLDPRIQVTDQASGAISVAGVNNRFNTISVDGMSQGDPFGLNANGMPYVGSPISVDTIAAYDLKVSDYDVASDTVGATVNAVTKSGTNEFHGSVYYAYKDAGSMVGSRDGEDYNLFDTDITKGVTFGGPILKDRLFFFGSYEEQTIKNFGGTSSSDGLANGYVSSADVEQAIAIANQLGLQPGVYGATGVNLDNKRYLAKLDWNISDYHRASLTYQQTEEFRPSPYDQRAENVVLSSHWYNIDNITKNTSLQLFSDWTENFSTEFKVSHQKFDQVNGNPVNQPEVEIETADGGSIFIGEDNNRHENQINTKRLAATLSGTYYAGDHVIKGGLDYLRNDVFNLYGRDLHGSYVFASLEDFADGNYDSYALRTPAPGFDINDTAAALVYTQVSPFIQDTWQVNNNLSLTYGVRVNIPKADKAPVAAPGFEEAFGFRNDYKLGSDNKVVLPRVSFNYTFDSERYSQLRGGIGSFQSVPPFVWLANPYQNNGGVTALSYFETDPENAPFSPDPYNQNIPEDGSPANQIDVIDPDFKLPTVWKASLGYDAELPWYGLIGTVEVQHIRDRDGAFYRALNIGEVQGTLADGRESYWCNLNGSTSSSNKNCGLNPAFSYNSTVLSNTDKGSSTAVTFSLNKPLANGWYGNLSYTYTKAKEVGSNASSQAWSSYQFVSRLNPNEEIAGTASREIRNSIKASLGWEHAFFGDYKTSITAFYNGRDGLPYTWIMNGDVNGDRIFQDPAYIPLINDPMVSYGSATAEQIAAFHAFIDSDPYLASHRGQIAGRNEARLPWINQLDVSLQQELPGFFKEHKSIIRLDIYNFLNMLNKDWGVTEEIGGFDTRYFANLGRVNADGTYVYNIVNSSGSPTYQSLRPYDANSSYPSRVVSRWSVLMTLRYEF
ncbi:carboxypeptidase regulatory-like domain-containing protein [Pseudoxanthomonas sp. F37]|uniref:TonB-dependent receptor n=1 Tax=Pseudoxanthomonas sp. F37 TaxID=2932492 RepID=UPI001FD27B12|nr:carboxypeptidase regulatory-like domain-containing protein [Pseudoxanthomonas sp. F37]UOV09726.1 carboxypeptidase regulatory-like domain-containing protein [Pseudoxanthomonas sp. F37]